MGCPAWRQVWPGWAGLGWALLLLFAAPPHRLTRRQDTSTHREPASFRRPPLGPGGAGVATWPPPPAHWLGRAGAEPGCASAAPRPGPAVFWPPDNCCSWFDCKWECGRFSSKKKSFGPPREATVTSFWLENQFCCSCCWFPEHNCNNTLKYQQPQFQGYSAPVKDANDDDLSTTTRTCARLGRVAHQARPSITKPSQLDTNVISKCFQLAMILGA